MPPAKKAAKSREPLIIVPDTSVLVDGRLTQRIQEGELVGATILIANASIAELEWQANSGRESGFSGLDEVVKIQELREAADLDVRFMGDRPSGDEIELARVGEVDAMIRDVAVKNGGRLLTSDRVQAHVARAMGLDVEWVRPETRGEVIEEDISKLGIMKFFDENTMSVHLKQDVVPMAKIGTPGTRKLVRLSDKPMELGELTRMRREIIEAAKRDAHSFIEIERHGATVVQLANMRIAIAQPPFADAVEITAVRPVTKLDISAYALAAELMGRLEDIQRGVFVSGPPGSGKSTFAAAIAEHLRKKNVIVKTMESPRDLQVSDEITQYAPLEKDMELTADVLLLVRPDFVIYDEVRKTKDFEIFGDMRLAGVGLIGVTHANRAIDAVQRLIGRVELGMIPQVVDTVIHIIDGKIQQVLELSFTVKVPSGMMEADLARPVIVVKDFSTKRSEFEIYTYGEQVVVMPIEGMGGEKKSGASKLAGEQLKHVLRRYIDGAFEVEMTTENAATLFVPERDVPMVIGKGGANVKQLQEVTGLSLDVRPLASKVGWTGRKDKPRFDAARPLRRELADYPLEEKDADEDADEDEENDDAPRSGASRHRFAEVTPELRKSKKNIVLLVDRGFAGQTAEVVIDDESVLKATIGRKGDVRIARNSDQGEIIMDAVARGEVVRLRV